MANLTSSKSSGRLGTKLRHKLAVSHSVVNEEQSKLYYVYSPRSDQDWVLKGDLQWAHFLYVESDSSVKTAEYRACEHSVFIGDSASKTRFASCVTFKDDRTEYRQLWSAATLEKHTSASRLEWEEKADAAAMVGVNYRRYTEREIFDCPQKLANWMRVIAWLAATRGRSLYHEILTVGSLIHAHGGATLAQIRDLGNGADQSNFVAAALRGIQSGILKADLEHTPLTANTFVEKAD